MKRSEAVEDIKTLIELNLESLKEVPDATLIANTIMYRLEAIGMLPPVNTTMYNHDGLIIEPTWEPEETISKYTSTEDRLKTLSIDELFDELDLYSEDKEYWAFIREEIRRRLDE